MNKYQNLSRYLRDSEKTSVILRFSKIESIIGSKLPDSARKYHQWWANNKDHSQAMSWLEIGWNVDKVNFNEKEVTFFKIKTSNQNNTKIKQNIEETHPKKGTLNPKQFEKYAREFLSNYFKVELKPGRLSGIPKEFDMVSPDKTIVGDAKFIQWLEVNQYHQLSFQPLLSTYGYLKNAMRKTNS